MKKIAVNTLKPGLVFSQPVYIDKDNILVPAGSALREKDIAQLVSWGIAEVETEGDILHDAPAQDIPGSTPASQKPAPSPGDSKRSVPNALSLTEVQENKAPYRTYMSLIERLDTIFIAIAAGVPIETRAIDNITYEMLQEVRDRRTSFIDYILGGEVVGREMAKSSVNIAILSALLASDLKLAHHKILHIAIGALLHDVGMLRIPREILNKRGGLSDAERTRIAGHPLLAHKIVIQEFHYPPEVGLVILQHHERWDGGGYPQRIAGKDIDLGARIVSVADAFEAMVSQKPYRNSMVGYQAMKNLLSDNSRRFDPSVLKIFIQTMGIYPIGSIVLLNNAALARVIEVRADAPLRPKIHLLIDGSGTIFKPNEGDIIDLLAEKSLFIVKAVDPRELIAKNG